MLVGGQCLKALSRLLGPENSSSPLTLSQWIAVYAALQASSAFVPSLASSAAVAGAGSAAFLLFWFLATWFSAAAGVQRHTSSVPPLPSDFYSLAADSPHERAFAALGGLGVALFAWSNAFAPEVQATLRRPAGATMRRSTLAAFGALVPCYVLIAALGFWAFGKGSNVLVLLNMVPASRGGVGSPETAAPRAAVAVAWLAVLVNLYALFAVYAFPVYECLDAFVARRVAAGGRTRRRSGEAKKKKEGEAGKGAPPPASSSSSPPPRHGRRREGRGSPPLLRLLHAHRGRPALLWRHRRRPRRARARARLRAPLPHVRQGPRREAAAGCGLGPAGDRGVLRFAGGGNLGRGAAVAVPERARVQAVRRYLNGELSPRFFSGRGEGVEVEETVEERGRRFRA